MIRLFLASIFFCLATSPVNGKVVINEFLASNNEDIPDKDGEFHDWIELYNKGQEPYNLEGHYMTDDAEELEWEFPEVIIEPGEFLLLYASGKDRKEGELHTNFRISKDGDPVILTDERGFIIDEVPPLELPTDYSYGRVPDGGDQWYYFDNPTPAESNQEAEAFEGLTEKPDFSQKPGFHEDEFELELIPPHPDAQIYFTLDGSYPTTDDKKYEGPIELEELEKQGGELADIPIGIHDHPGHPDYEDFFHGHTIRAIAKRPNFKESYDKSGTFFITPEGRDRYSMPVVSFQLAKDSILGEERGIHAIGDDPEDPNFRQRGDEWERPAHFELFDNDREQYFNQNIGLRTHGNYSRELPKKNFRIYSRRIYRTNPLNYPLFPDQDLHEFKRVMFRQSSNDWGGQWARNVSDHRGTIFRDALGQEIVADMDFEVQANRQVIIFLNGEYWGIYNMRERYDRFYVATNYHFHRDSVDQLENNMNIDEGERDHYEQMRNFIRNNDLSDPDNYSRVQTKMDVSNFIDYQIGEVFMNNYDWPHNNIRYWRKRTNEYQPDAPKGHDGRWRWMMNDVDFGLGLYPQGADYNMLDHFRQKEEGEEWATALIRNLLDNKGFYHDFVRTFCDHLNTTFERQKMLRLLESFENRFEPEIQENIDRWKAPKTKSKWRENVNNVRHFLANRSDYIWKYLEDFSKHGDKQPLILQANNSEKGYVKLNGITISGDDFTWKGDYFDELSLELEAVAHEGATFEGWTGDLTTSEQKIEVKTKNIKKVKALFDEDPDYSRPYSLPNPHSLEMEDYSFTSWPANASAGTYPSNMVFHQKLSKDPGIDADIVSDYHMAYDRASRSRIVGLDEEGFAFINTPETQDEPRAGFMGAAVLALDTRNRENIKLNWQGQTLNAHDRQYAIRVQYRKGEYGPFNNLKDKNKNFVEYYANVAGNHSQTLENIKLPEQLEDEEEVHLRFNYFNPHGETYYDLAEEGERARLAISSISVTSEPRDEEQEDLFTIYPNPASQSRITIQNRENVTSPLSLTLFDLSGKKVQEKSLETFSNLKNYELDLGELSSGVYMLHIEEGERREVKRLIIE